MRTVYLGMSLILLACVADKSTDSEQTIAADTAVDDSGMIDTGSTDTGEEGDPLSACVDLIEEPLDWFEETTTDGLNGALEFGQTHVTQENETRIAAPLIALRSTAILFSPDTPLADETDLRISAWRDGDLIGVLPMNPPDLLPEPLESDLTEVPLEPYSESAWSVLAPHDWVLEGTVLIIGHADSGTLYQRVKTLENLGAPHRFTITRSKILLWGDGEKNTDTMSASELLYDYFPTVPAAEVRLVDSLPWHVDEFVVKTDQGPLLVASEEERLAVTNQDHHWALFKHQFTLRHSLANTGRGLAMTGESEGDSSPYSFGTSLHMGWFERPDGGWQDIDDAPWAAGWTGWTAMWVNECGNGFIHEFGHSMTMLHFTEGTGVSWGIGDQYPQDGVNLESHPWGYDTQRNRFRTWYRVDANGPTMGEDGNLIGKRDPMNGGESANAATCFPQYTNYHARQAQAFFQNNKTIMNGDQGPGIYLWDPSLSQYVQSFPDESHQQPHLVDVPVFTVIGTLAQTDPETQIYPAIHAISGNVFELPDPADPNLPIVYHGGQYVVEIDYADGSLDRAMIAQSAITDTALGLFSLNLEAERMPVQLRLYRSQASAYPNLNDSDLTLMHSRSVTVPQSPPPVLHVGKGRHANAELTVSNRCEPGLNCQDRWSETLWNLSTHPLRFADQQGQTPSASVCGDESERTAITVPVVNESGQSATVVVHAQRLLRNGQQERVYALNDETPWLSSPDLQQGLRLWLPWEENAELSAGTWTTDGEFIIEGFTADGLFSQTPINIALTVFESTAVNLATEYISPGLETPDSSLYFLCADPRVGPTSRIWWGNWDGWTELSVPVIDTANGSSSTLYLIAQQEELGSRWEMHAGRSAGNNQHHVVLRVDPNANGHLIPGTTYFTSPSAPLVIEGRRWHDPDGQALIETFAFDIEFSP